MPNQQICGQLSTYSHVRRLRSPPKSGGRLPAEQARANSERRRLALVSAQQVGNARGLLVDSHLRLRGREAAELISEPDRPVWIAIQRVGVNKALITR